MKIGVHLPVIDFGQTDHSLHGFREYTRVAKTLGYEYLAVNDHLVFGKPWMDGITILSSVLSESGDMKLATTVAVPVLRGPIATAKILAAIDILSDGRLTVGVGPGSSSRDYALLGIPFEERWKRLDESIEVLRSIWRKSSPPYQGHYYSTANEELEPYPVKNGGPDIWVGSWGSAAGMRRVVRLGDGWLASAYNTDPVKFADGLTAQSTVTFATFE